MRNEARAAMRAGGAEPVLAAEGFDLPEEEEKKEFKFKSVFTGEKIKNGFRKIGVRNLVIVLAVLLIGGAVYANWRLFGQTAKPSGDATVVDNNRGDDNTATAASYFSASQVERQRARDEAIEVLQSVVDNASEADAAAKEEAMQGISAIASSIEREANIESLIKAKGFENCVAVINGSKASIVVSGEGLKPNELSQILEIVYVQANILPENVTITEVG